MEFNIFLSIFSIVFSFGALLVAFFAKNIVGTWINPSSIFSGFWFLFLIIPLMVGWGIPVNPAAIFYIFLFLAIFSSTALFFPWRYALALNKEKQSAKDIFDNNIFFGALFFISVLVVLFFVIDLKQQGLGFSGDLFGISAQYAALHYSGGLIQNVYIKMATILSFLCVVLAGLVGAATTSRFRCASAVALGFMPSIFLILFQGAKGSLFFSASLFFGAYLVVKIYNKDFSIFSGKFIFRIFLALVFVLALVTISFVIRGGSGEDGVEVMISHLKYSFLSYSSGHLFAFSDWFTDRYFYASSMEFVQEKFTLGFYTFMSIFQLIGDNRFVPLGVYDDYFDYDGMLSTNIYTLFRGLISDFTLIGSFVFALIFGFVCNGAFYNLLVRRFSSFSIAFFIFSVAFFYQSYIISSLTWLSIPVSLLFLIVFLFLYKHSRHLSREFLELNSRAV